MACIVSVVTSMIWKINIVLVICSLQLAFSLPQVQKREVSPTPNVVYEKNMNSKVLGVLKKVYSDLVDVTDRQRSSFPRTYGMSLTGQQGFVWNMLNDASKTFGVGSPSGKNVKNARDEKSIPEEEQAAPQEEVIAEEEDPKDEVIAKEVESQDEVIAEEVEPQESGGSVYLQMFSELLENEDFWEWLTSWIETYTELLDEHIKVEVEAEVTKQLKDYFERVDYLIKDEENSEKYTDPVDDTASTEYTEQNRASSGSKGFVTSQNVSNSTVNNEYLANIYFTDPKAEKTLIDKLAKAIVSLNDKGDFVIPTNATGSKN